ncbi:MAG: nitrile hydratase subunit alpha [SAR324 cluster bacterium]|nr:nitrile hydratase subunit alpha [SAR324 cluster bacterium]
MSHTQTHGHGHPHDPIEDNPDVRPEHLLLEQAMRELLIEKGVFSAADVTRQIEDMDAITPAQGSTFVAKYWTDPEFRKAAQKDGKAAAESMGIDMSVAPELVILENTPEVHHVVVCTLCSCYPRAVLGLPPAWYKSANYRSRMVVEPRAVLQEFGLELPAEVEVRVVDSNADMRYLVVPMRPPGTQGFSESQLAELVSRDSMIGVAQARSPGKS